MLHKLWNALIVKNYIFKKTHKIVSFHNLMCNFLGYDHRLYSADITFNLRNKQFFLEMLRLKNYWTWGFLHCLFRNQFFKNCLGKSLIFSFSFIGIYFTGGEWIDEMNMLKYLMKECAPRGFFLFGEMEKQQWKIVFQ